LGWIVFAVEIASKAEVAVNPGDVGFFGPLGDVKHPHVVAELIEQFGLFNWVGGGIFLHGSRHFFRIPIGRKGICVTLAHRLCQGV
jgi:hypothetical protein